MIQPVLSVFDDIFNASSLTENSGLFLMHSNFKDCLQYNVNNNIKYYEIKNIDTVTLISN